MYRAKKFQISKILLAALEKITSTNETKSHDNEDKSYTTLMLDMLVNIPDCEEKAMLKGNSGQKNYPYWPILYNSFLRKSSDLNHG